ncbi:MAG: 50S ribosomal protein L9, partial [Bdellovibrionales bacterium]|nr:50S ribosomal protein L9 [Bdellovibrionales bacterium]
MELILQKDVKNLGKAGDRVSVRPGYARNYLLPKKLALTLDEGRLGEWKHKQQVIEASKKKAALERDQLLEKLSSIHLVFERESRAGGHLFGSVSPVDISRELEQQHGLLVDKRDITTEPLKTEGEHQIKISLDTKRQTEIKVTVKKILLEK